MQNNLPVCLLLAFAGNALIAAGQSLQKSQVSRFDTTAPAGDKLCKAGFWLAGILSSNAGLALIYLATNFGYTTIVGAMNASALAVLLLIARYLLKEPVHPGEIAGVALIIAGVAVMPIRPSSHVPAYVFSTRAVWLTVLADAILFAALITAALVRKAKTGFLLAAFAGTMTAVSQIFQKISHLDNFIASLGGFQQTFYKWVWIPFFLPSVLSLQFAYRKNKVVTVIPVFNAFTVVASIAAGQAFFHERLSVLQWTGVGTILAGVVLINVFANRTASGETPAP